MPAIQIPQIKWGKRKERSQICEIFTSDGRIVHREEDVLHGCAQDTKLSTQDGHILSAENQFFDPEIGAWVQLINELLAVPICLIKPLEDAEARTQEIFKDARIAAQLEKLKEAARAMFLEKLVWIISIVCGTFIIIAFLQFMQHKGG